MNLPRIYLIAILLPAFGVGTKGQEPSKAVLVDEFKTLTCEDLLSRLDMLAFEATKNPNSIAFVVIFPGKNVFQTVAYERAVRNNSVFRRIPETLIRVIKSTGRDELAFELWRSPADKVFPIRDFRFDYRLSNISGRTRFVDDSVEVFRLEGKLEYGTGGCISQFNLDVLSKILSANPILTAEIIIFNRSLREGRKLSRLILHDAISESRISKKRLRINYGGSGKAKDWSSKVSSIEIWLQPTKIR